MKLICVLTFFFSCPFIKQHNAIKVANDTKAYDSNNYDSNDDRGSVFGTRPSTAANPDPRKISVLHPPSIMEN